MTNLYIYDFDQTITQKHTFGTHCIEYYAGKNTEEIYKQGMVSAVSNIKAGFSEVFKHDDLYTSAIATYHNNPAFIAGNIAFLLNKKLALVETRFSKAPVVAIDIYDIEGLDRPFLISYIHEVDYMFQKRLTEIDGKNNQIQFLQETLLELGQIKGNAVIYFYDDSRSNYDKSQKIAQVNSYHINANTPVFQIIASKSNATKSFSENATVKSSSTDTSHAKRKLTNISGGFTKVAVNENIVLRDAPTNEDASLENSAKKTRAADNSGASDRFFSMNKEMRSTEENAASSGFLLGN